MMEGEEGRKEEGRTSEQGETMRKEKDCLHFLLEGRMVVGRFEIVTQTGRDIQVLTLEFALNRFGT